MSVCRVYRFCLHAHVNIWASDQKHWHCALCGMECTSLQSARAVNTCDRHLCFNLLQLLQCQDICWGLASVLHSHGYGAALPVPQGIHTISDLPGTLCLYGAQYVLSLLISLMAKKSPAFSLCQVFIIVEILMLSILRVFKLFFISFKQRAAIAQSV